MHLLTGHDAFVLDMLAGATGEHQFMPIGVPDDSTEIVVDQVAEAIEETVAILQGECQIARMCCEQIEILVSTG